MKIRLYQRQGIGEYLDTKILTVENAAAGDLDKMLALFNDEPVLVAKDLDPDQAESIRDQIQKELDQHFSTIAAAVEAPTKPETGKPEQHSRPRTLPLLSKSVGHQVETVGHVADNVRVGPDGTFYLAETDCPQCKKVNESWTKSHNKYIPCRSCGFRLEQRPATEQSLEADKNGHYFKASKKYEHYVHRK